MVTMQTDLRWDQITTADEDGDVVHLIPVDDLVEHTIETACACGPECQSVGGGTVVFSHWPLDRRP